MTTDQLDKAEAILKDTPQFKLGSIRYIVDDNSLNVWFMEDDGTDAIGVFYMPIMINYFKEYQCLFYTEDNKIILHIY